jgi:hypothetical protein
MDIRREIDLEEFTKTISDIGEHSKKFKGTSIERMNCIIYLLRYTILHRHLWERNHILRQQVMEAAHDYKKYSYGNKVANFDRSNVELIYSMCDEIIHPADRVIG